MAKADFIERRWLRGFWTSTDAAAEDAIAAMRERDPVFCRMTVKRVDIGNGESVATELILEGWKEHPGIDQGEEPI